MLLTTTSMGHTGGACSLHYGYDLCHRSQSQHLSGQCLLDPRTPADSQIEESLRSAEIAKSGEVKSREALLNCCSWSTRPPGRFQGAVPEASIDHSSKGVAYWFNALPVDEQARMSLVVDAIVNQANSAGTRAGVVAQVDESTTTTNSSDSAVFDRPARAEKYDFYIKHLNTPTKLFAAGYRHSCDRRPIDRRRGV